MKCEKSTTTVLTFGQGGKFINAKSGFHDEFDALEWAEKNMTGKVVIQTERVIVLD